MLRINTKNPIVTDEDAFRRMVDSMKAKPICACQEQGVEKISYELGLEKEATPLIIRPNWL